MKKMLVIEDEAGVIDPFENYVQDEMRDYLFFKASTGEEGLRIIDREHPDLLILDMKLDPFMDGLQVLRQVRNVLSRMAVIVLTGFVDPTMETEARKIGVDAYMEKPVDLEELRKTIDEVMKRREMGETAQSTDSPSS